MKDFGEFGSSIKMRLYSLQKSHFVGIFLIFFAFLFLSFLIGLVGPKILETSTISANKLQVDVKSGPFLLETPILGKFNQELWLFAEPIANQMKEEFSKSFTVNLNIHKENEDGDLLSDKDQHLMFFNRTRTLHCKNEKCDSILVFHLDYINRQKYKIDLKFIGLEDTSIKIDDIIFKLKWYKTSFTKLELWLRFIFLLFTFVVLMIFSRSLSKFHVKDWTIEQKWIFILLRALILFNNPLYPLNVLINSWIPHLIDAIFCSLFYSLLLISWLSIYHGVRQNDRNFTKFYLPKIILVSFLWTLSIILAILQISRSIHDPTYNFYVDEQNFLIFQILFIVFMVLYALYLLFLVARAIGELKNTPFFDMRIRFALILMVIVVVTYVTLNACNYNSISIKQSLFEHFMKNYHSTIEFTMLYSLFNFYLFTLAFVYSPSENSSYDAEYRDNITFTMLNDSDEDVIYGSDTEESKKSLRNNSKK